MNQGFISIREMSTMTKRREDPNESIDRAALRRYWRLAQAVECLDSMMEEWSTMGMIITSVRVRGPEETRGGYMMVIKAIDESRKPFVAFRTAGTVEELLTKVLDDVDSGHLQFKEEQPYDPTGEKAKAKA